MIHKEKYFKYKKKYLNLKRKIQKSGNNCKFTTIENDGNIDGMSNQCLWISIKDYLTYVKNYDITVRQIREIGNLGPDTEKIEFNEDNPQLKNALEEIANFFDLKIEIYSVLPNRAPDPNMFDVINNQIPVPRLIVNKNLINIVPIASFGGHFELITSGCHIIQLHLINQPKNLHTFTPKVYSKKKEIYIDPETLVDKQEKTVASKLYNIINNKLTIEYLNLYKIKLENEKFKKEDVNLLNISSNNLNEEDKSIFHAQTEEEIYEIEKHIKAINLEIDELTANNLADEDIINNSF